jgi:hypothetical protein
MLPGLLLILSATLSALPVKVTAIDHYNGRVTLLLPIHHSRIEAELVPEEPEVRLHVNQFYDAEFEAGEIDTVKRNVLKVTIPGERAVRLRLRKITFLQD